jgi:Mrp family chromosome partitioning ATPase/capsular polysaccharide biosynthesis protein
MKRYLELLFRRPVLLSLPMAVALVVGAGYALHLPRSYVSSSNLFVDTFLPNPSSLEQGVAPGGSTPATEKLTTLQEFLRTQSFDNKVAQRATGSGHIDDLTAAAIAKTIRLSTSGPQILNVSVKSTNPTLAARTVQAVTDEFSLELGQALQQRNTSLATVLKADADSGATRLSSAQSALAAYLQTHPNNPDDAEETRLTNEVAAAQTQRDQAVARYNQARVAGGSGASSVDPTALHVVDPPKVPTLPTSRKKQLVMTGLGSLLGGGVLTLLILVLLVAGDHSVREVEDLEGVFKHVGSVPKFANGVLPSVRHRAREAHEGFWVPERLIEACRPLVRQIGQGERNARSVNIVVGSSPPTLDGLSEGYMNGRSVPSSGPSSGRAARVIGVTSCLRGEGRTTIAAGLAAAAHEAYRLRTILVELDFERPSMAKEYGIIPAPGVAEVLRGEASLERCLNVPPNGSVAVLVAGDAKGNGAELFGALRRSNLMEDLTRLGDEIVADLPVYSSIPEPAWLAKEFSTVLLVARSGMAPVSQMRQVVDELEITQGAVLNGASSSIPRPILRLLES